jgi:hypothetical protein
MGNAYALIFERCNTALQAKLKARKDFYSKVKNDPIELLKAIQQYSISYQEKRYEEKAHLEGIKSFVLLKQKEDESLVEYTSRFKAARDVMVSQIGGPIVFTKLVEQRLIAKPSAQKDQLIKEAFGEFVAFTYLENADKTKYGTLVSGLESQFSLGNDQYPKTLTDANNVLSNHKFDQAYADLKKKQKQQRQQQSSQQATQQRTQEQSEEAPELSFAQMEGKCYCCGKPGHKSPTCRHKNKPKSEWAINKTPEIVNAQNVMSEVSTRDDRSIAPSQSETPAQQSQSSSLPFGWMANQIPGVLLAQGKEKLREWILLDSQSSVDLFCNPNLVTDIVDVDERLVLSTNAGDLVSSQMATVPAYGQVWFNE